MSLPTDDKARKATPIWTGCMMYFPDALAAVAEVSRIGNDQHNPGEPLHWAREKSTDQMNTALRHMIDHGTGNLKDTDGAWHLAKAIWRLSAELQLTIEREQAAPLAVGLGQVVTFKEEKPRQADQITENSCSSQTSVFPFWGCERPYGHSGNHMAWAEFPHKLYPNGEWS